MFRDFTVQIPKDKGKICRQKTKTATYIHYVLERTYDLKKKHTVPKRALIGRVDETQPERMYPNDAFFEHYPQSALPELRQDAKRSSTLAAGAYIVIDHIIKHLKIDKLAQKHFGDKAGLFLDLAAYMLVEQHNQGQYYPHYAYRHPLFSENMRPLNDSTVSSFLSGVSDDQISDFLNDWNADRDHRSRIYISYDSTNKNSQAGDIDLVEFGKAKDEKGLPIFNIGLAYDQTNQVPLFYELYPGSINDVSQLKYFVDKAVEYNYRNIGFILDRGYFSKGNIRYMDEKGFAFVMMVKGCKRVVSSVVDELRGTFEHRRACVLPGHLVSGTTVERKLFEDDTRTRYLHVYFSADRMADESRQLEMQLDQMKALYRKSIGKKIEFSRAHTEYFDFYYDKEGRLRFAREKTEAIEQQMLRCGYFCIATSEKMTALEAYCLYKGRDASEKLFSADKSFLGSKSMRVQTAQAVSAKILIEFVSLIIRNRIYNLLKDEMLKLKKRKNFMTVPAAIRELEKIEIVRINSGVYQLDHAVTHTQEIILNSFGISKDEVYAKIGAISKVLSNPSTVAEEIDDDEEGESYVEM